LIKDLLSKTQSSQEFQTFDWMIPDKPEEFMPVYALTFGSSFTWNLYGGANFWKEFTDDYKSTWTIESTANKDLISLDLDSVSSTNTIINVRCEAPSSQSDLK